MDWPLRYSHQAERARESTHHLHTRHSVLANSLRSTVAWPPETRHDAYTLYTLRETPRDRVVRAGVIFSSAMHDGLACCCCCCCCCCRVHRTLHRNSSSSLDRWWLVAWYKKKKKKTGVEEMEREREKERGRGRLLHPDRNLIARYLFPLPCTASEISWPFLRRVTLVQMHRTSFFPFSFSFFFFFFFFCFVRCFFLFFSLCFFVLFSCSRLL